MTGVYIIKCTANDMVYVGSSRGVAKRIRSHMMLLSSGKHYNKSMQRDFDLFGKKTFMPEVVEYCTVGQMHEAEKTWIDKHRPMVYNVNQPPNAMTVKRAPKEFATLRVAIKLDKSMYEYLMKEKKISGNAMPTVLRKCISRAIKAEHTLSSNLG